MVDIFGPGSSSPLVPNWKRLLPLFNLLVL